MTDGSHPTTTPSSFPPSPASPILVSSVATARFQGPSSSSVLVGIENGVTAGQDWKLTVSISWAGTKHQASRITHHTSIPRCVHS